MKSYDFYKGALIAFLTSFVFLHVFIRVNTLGWEIGTSMLISGCYMVFKIVNMLSGGDDDNEPKLN